MSRADTVVRVASPTPDRVFAALIDPGVFAGPAQGSPCRTRGQPSL